MLILSNNSIGLKGMETIAEANLSSLIHLTLEGNVFDDAGERSRLYQLITSTKVKT